MNADTDELRAVSAAEGEALARLLQAATDLLNAKLATELAGTDFAAALRGGRASISLAIELPSGKLSCTARFPAMSAEPLRLFDVVPPQRPRLS